MLSPAERLENPALDFLTRACALFSAIQDKPKDKRMECPYCASKIPERWQPLFVVTKEDGTALKDPSPHITAILDSGTLAWAIGIGWLRCYNAECGRIVVRVSHTSYDPRSIMIRNLEMVRESEGTIVEEWLAVPFNTPSRHVDPLVRDPYRGDYLEAAAILDASPRMSAVLSRRILADLLKQYGKLDNHNLSRAIDAFIENTTHPSIVRENLHHLRELGGVGAHTQTDATTGEIVNVSPEEAEWTLGVLDSLFDYFIVGPEKNRQRRAALDQKFQAAGRKPIKQPE